METDFKQQNIFGMGHENQDYAQFFNKNSYLNELATLTKEGMQVANVTFEPGCRNNWHIHHDGYQLLLVTAGQGWYQEEGAPAKKLLPGDVVYIAEGIKHWHGATKDSWFAHVAITKGTSEWLESVDFLD